MTSHTETAKRRRRWVPWAGAALALVVGISIGAGGGDDSATEAATAASKPAVTVTPPPKTVTAPPVTVAPPECAEALAAADTVMQTTGRAFNLVADAMTAAAEFDVSGVDKATRQLDTLTTDQLTPQLDAYKTARAACR